MASASKDSMVAAAPKAVGLRLVQPREAGILLALTAALLAVAAPESHPVGNLPNDARNLPLAGTAP